MLGLKEITGAVLGPQEAFLILRGQKTLTVRMDAIGANAPKVMDFLTKSLHVQQGGDRGRRLLRPADLACLSAWRTRRASLPTFNRHLKLPAIDKEDKPLCFK